MNELTIVTTTNRVDGWYDYCEHIKHLQDIYGTRFDVLILDNSPIKSSEIKRNMLTTCLGKRGSKVVNYLHYDTFVECRNQQRFNVNTKYLTILDDDDKLTESFLQIFNFIHNVVGDFDYANLSKTKYRQSEITTIAFETLSSLTNDLMDRKFDLFYDYDNYKKDKMNKVYPINGYCIISTDLYKEVGETTEHYVDDCLPMMRCYLECKKGYKIGLPWQYYKIQNRFMEDFGNLSKCEESFNRQLRELLKLYPNNRVVVKQISNCIKALQQKLILKDEIRVYKPELLYNLKLNL